MEHQPNEDDGVLLAMNLATLSILPMVAKVAVELNVFEIIAQAGPGARLSSKEITSHLNAQNPHAASMLDRMLRLLASHSLLTSSTKIHDNGLEERVYSLGPVSKYLVKNKDGVSFSPFLVLLQDKVLMDSWYYLKDAILEGGLAFHKAFGLQIFDYAGTNPRFGQIFNHGMSGSSTIFSTSILETYKGFEGLEVVVDVGGGIGSTINIITSKYPTIKGINFDLPHVIEQAPSYPGMHVFIFNTNDSKPILDVTFKLITGVEHVGGDMFESVPHGDAILIKWILHDWSDEMCLKLLNNCYTALPENGKLVVVEAILPVQVETNTSANCLYQLDVLMMAVAPGGKERSEEEFVALAKGAGFSRINKACFLHYCWVMELYKL